MLWLLMRALPVLLLATLPACDSSYSAGAPDVARETSRHCLHCGWIQSKREIGPDASAPGAAVIYEYTMRLRDGSVHVFRESSPSSWREGQRLILIKGEDADD